MSIFKKIISFTKTDSFAAAGIYTFTNFFAKGVAFLLLFIYSNPAYITVEENGLLSLLSSSILFVTPFVYLGILQSTSTDFFKLDKTEFKNYFSTSFILPVIATCISIILFLFFFKTLSKNYNFQQSFIWLIPCIVFLLFCNEQYASLVRNNNKPKLYLKIGLLRIFAELGISVSLVVFFAWHWKGRVAGIAISQLIIALFAFLYFKNKGYLFGKIERKYIKEDLVFAVPVIVMQISLFCMSASDKFFLSRHTDNYSVGVYSYACIFASIISTFCSALLQYLMPKLYKYLAEKKVNYHAVKKHFYFYFFISFLALVGVVILTPFLYHHFIHKSYYPGLDYLYLLAVGYFVWSMTYFFYSFMLFHKQKKKILFLSLISIGLSLGSNLFFIPRYGASGAAVAVCLSYLLLFIITLFFSRKYVKLIFNSSKPTNSNFS